VIKIDNRESNHSVKAYKAKLIREIKVTSAGGVEFTDRTELFKKKFEDVVPAKEAQDKNILFPMS